jgi:hypothetical protein
MTLAADARSTDLVTVPRSGIEESWMDVTTLSFEVRRDLGRAYQARERGADPLPHLFLADQRLIRLNEYSRRQAAEAAGITYIHPSQLSLFDGCLPDGDRAG